MVEGRETAEQEVERTEVVTQVRETLVKVMSLVVTGPMVVAKQVVVR